LGTPSIGIENVNVITSVHGWAFGQTSLHGSTSGRYGFFGTVYGVSISSNVNLIAAYGKGSFEGEFSTLNIGLGRIGMGIFWSQNWFGVTFGLSGGLPVGLYWGKLYYLKR